MVGRIIITSRLLVLLFDYYGALRATVSNLTVVYTPNTYKSIEHERKREVPYLRLLFHILSVELLSSCRALYSLVALIGLQLVLDFAPALLNVHVVVRQQVKKVLLHLQKHAGRI